MGSELGRNGGVVSRRPWVLPMLMRPLWCCLLTKERDMFNECNETKLYAVSPEVAQIRMLQEKYRYLTDMGMMYSAEAVNLRDINEFLIRKNEKRQ